MSQTAIMTVNNSVCSWIPVNKRPENRVLFSEDSNDDLSKQQYLIAKVPQALSTPCRSASDDSSGCYAGRKRHSEEDGFEEVASSLAPLKRLRQESLQDFDANAQRESHPSIALPESPISSETNVQSPGGSGSCSSPLGLDKQLTREILHVDMDQTRSVATPPSNFHFENPNIAGRNLALETIWEGSVKHRVSADKTIELFGLVLPVPRDLIESFPPTLFVSELIPLHQVTRAPGDAVAHCSFQGVSDEHCRTILKLAETKLCLAVRLQDCDLWLNPVHLSNGKLGSRCVFKRTM